MTLVIVFVVIGFILGIVALFSDNFDGCALFIMPIVGAVLFGIIGLIIAAFVGMFLPTSAVANEPIYLHNLYDQSELEGNFFLGIGSIDGVDYIHYSVKEADGGIIFRKIEKESIRVYEDDPELPYLQTYSPIFKSEWMTHIGLSPSAVGIPAPEFHVPTGSVDGKYNIR